MDRNCEDIQINEDPELEDEYLELSGFMDFVANDSKSIC